MKCPRCGQMVSMGARFCSNCGQQFMPPPGLQPQGAAMPGPQKPVTPQAGMGQPQPAYSGGPMYAPISPPSTKRWVVPTVVSACFLVLALIGLNLAGVLKFGTKLPDDPSLRLKAKTTEQSLAIQERTPPPPSLMVQGSGKPQMPADVYAWLKHLERIEKRKQDIDAKADEEIAALIPQLQSASGISTPEQVDELTDPDNNMKTAPGAETVDQTVQDIQNQLGTLKSDFDSVTPPAECQPIADAYDGALIETSATAGDVAKIVDSIDTTSKSLKGDISNGQDQLHDIGKNHVKGIDDQFKTSDQLVQDICDKYGVRKWFDIDSKGGGASPLSSFGF